jgi:predicted RNA-binding protein with PUA-like domain
LPLQHEYQALVTNAEHFDPKASVEKPIWYTVDVRYVEPMQRIVTLNDIKQNPLLAEMPLVKRSRLSIQPITENEWQIILIMGGMHQGPGNVGDMKYYR